MLEQLLQALKREEGEVKENGSHIVYKDHLGKATIGHGRLVDAPGGLSDEEAEYLLTNDVTRCINDVSRVVNSWPWLNEARKAVLIMMAFQMGVSGLLEFRKMLTALDEKDYQTAAEEMLNSVWATQTFDRAMRMSDQMKRGEW